MIHVLIESDGGVVNLENSFAGYSGAMRHEWLHPDNYKIKITTLNGLSVVIRLINDSYILPIGSVEFMKKSAEILGIELPKPLNIPSELFDFCDRKVWNCNIKEVNYPCFIKPLEEAKLFTGFVAKNENSLSLYYKELAGFDGMVQCSEVLDNIVSEWRCFILNGKILNCSNYSGDPLIFPDSKKINFLIEKYKKAPSGYALDVAVLDNNETVLMEVNDGFALGNYGCDPEDYFKILKTRWFEIVKSSIEKNG
jgi:hypothetical protein